MRRPDRGRDDRVHLKELGIFSLDSEIPGPRSEVGELKELVQAQTNELKELRHELDKLQGRQTVAIPAPEQTGFPPFELHISVDADNPERLLVAAMFPGQVCNGDDARGASRMFVWYSEDGGRSWSKATAPFETVDRPPDRLSADAVVAFGTSSTCWIGSCDYDWHTLKPNYSSIKVSSSEDGGKTWQPPITVTELDNDKHGKGYVDKPWLAIDRSGGNHRGTMYVAWTRCDEQSKQVELRCAALPAGARQFAASVRLGQSIPFSVGGMNPGHHVQLAVRPNGILDTIWRTAPSGRLVHASSQDGGATFSNAAPIAENGSVGAGEFPSLVATTDGKLLVAWTQKGNNVLCSVRANGRWSPPLPLAGGALSYPAVAATADALWVLAYRTTGQPRRISIALYRSTDDGRSWKEKQVIASRTLTGGAAHIFRPGDYVGLVGSKGTLYAAYVLPGEDRFASKPQLYVSVLRTVREQ